MAYSCNGDPRGCERERFGGCDYHDGTNHQRQLLREIAIDEGYVRNGATFEEVEAAIDGLRTAPERDRT